jgi:exodeoxyribonuclease VII large subunit
MRLEQRQGELRMGIERWLVAKRRRLEAVAVKLDERSPLRLLQRGYAICYDSSGRVLRSVEAVALGDEIAVRLARGRLAATVKGKREA